MMKQFGLFLTILFLSTIPAGNILAAPARQSIGEGETYNGDIQVFSDEQLMINAGGIVNGDITIYGGNANIAGTVNGNVTILGGQITLSGNLIGDLVMLGGDLQITETSSLTGDCIGIGSKVDDPTNVLNCEKFGPIPGISSLGQLVPPKPPTPPTPPSAPLSLLAGAAGFVWNLLGAIGKSIFMGLLALVIAALFPRHLQQIGQAIHQKPIASGVVGTLTSVASLSLLVLLLVILGITCIGILLYPAVFVLGLLPLAAALMGWVAIGEMFGNALNHRLKIGQSQAITAALGTATLTFGLGLIHAFGFDFGRELIATILLLIGLGAATLTQFGTKPYPPPGLPAANSAQVQAVLETLPHDES